MDIRAKSIAEELQHALETVNEPEGRARLKAYLESKPFPRFMAHPTDADVFIREDADGSRTPGTIEGREFVPLMVMATSEAA